VGHCLEGHYIEVGRTGHCIAGPGASFAPLAPLIASLVLAPLG
jgi:hypothetical protein